ALGELSGALVAQSVQRVHETTVEDRSRETAPDSDAPVELAVQVGVQELRPREEIGEHERGCGALLDDMPRERVFLHRALHTNDRVLIEFGLTIDPKGRDRARLKIEPD